MSDERIELPEAWVWTTLGEAFNVYVGATPSRKASEYWNGSIPWVSSGEVAFCEIHETHETITELGLQNTSTEVHPPGTVLLGMIGEGKTRGQVAVLKIHASHNQNSAAIRLSGTGIPPEYIYQFLKLEYERIRQIGSGNNQPALNKSRVQSMFLPLAPLNEQKRIVAKIEELNDRHQRAKQALEAIPELCDRFRQSVLAAAFRGDLTTDWREQNTDVESSSVLLKDILYRRRCYWEKTELERMKLKGKTPKDDKWKLKYCQPIEPNLTDLPDLPNGWIWVTWDQISNWVTYGFTRPMPHVEEGIPIVTARHVTDGRIDITNTHKTTLEAFTTLSSKDCPQPGDILITKDGTIGRAAIVAQQEGNFCINQSVAVVWLRSCSINRRYLLAVIESPMTQKPIWQKARGNAIQHLSITDFAQMALPLPPLEEQEEIVKQIDFAFSAIERIEEAVEQDLIQAKSLNQSILAKAFRGELIEQDPNDEPASVLLDRIRAERQQQESKKSKGTRGKQKKATNEQLDLLEKE